MALLNIGTDGESTRVAAYNMLAAMCHHYNYDIKLQLQASTGLCIPSNPSHFIYSVSEKLAWSEPHLTLEFLIECLQGLNLSKVLLFEYLSSN